MIPFLIRYANQMGPTPGQLFPPDINNPHGGMSEQHVHPSQLPVENHHGSKK